MQFPQNDLTFGLFDTARGDELAEQAANALRAVSVWMQNNIAPNTLTPTDSGTPGVAGFKWNRTNQDASNYVGLRLRYDDTTYTGAGGISGGTNAANFIDATTSDLNTVKLYNATGVSADAKITTLASDGRFQILGTGLATITYRFKHPDDATKIVTGILFVNYP